MNHPIPGGPGRDPLPSSKEGAYDFFPHNEGQHQSSPSIGGWQWVHRDWAGLETNIMRVQTTPNSLVGRVWGGLAPGNKHLSTLSTLGNRWPGLVGSPLVESKRQKGPGTEGR